MNTRILNLDRCMACVFGALAVGNLAFVYAAKSPGATLAAAVACVGMAAVFLFYRPRQSS
jgi:hypothetical protein